MGLGPVAARRRCRARCVRAAPPAKSDVSSRRDTQLDTVAGPPDQRIPSRDTGFGTERCRSSALIPTGVRSSRARVAALRIDHESGGSRPDRAVGQLQHDAKGVRSHHRWCGTRSWGETSGGRSDGRLWEIPTATVDSNASDVITAGTQTPKVPPPHAALGRAVSIRSAPPNALPRFAGAADPRLRCPPVFLMTSRTLHVRPAQWWVLARLGRRAESAWRQPHSTATAPGTHAVPRRLQLQRCGDAGDTP